MHFRRKIFFLIVLSMVSCTVWSHGYVGKRFFPSNITIDEPTISDKIVLPIYYSESPATTRGSIWTTNPKLEYSKRITQYLQADISASYLSINHPHARTQNGFDNWLVGLRYNPFLDEHTETIFSLELSSQIGGSGSHIVNALATTTLSPEIIFAQGFGLLPTKLKFLKPFAFVVSASPEFVTNNFSLNTINWGFAIEYSFPYMQAFVSNSTMSWLNYTVPIIEFPFSTCKQGSCKGQTTGNIDPGFIFYNRYAQIGIEAIIPANSHTGNKVGGVIQFYLYLDNMFPDNRIGQPLLMERK